MDSAIRALIEKYRENLTARNDELNPYRDEKGEVIPGDQPYYDEDRADNAFDSEADLITLLDELDELISAKESE